MTTGTVTRDVHYQPGEVDPTGYPVWAGCIPNDTGSRKFAFQVTWTGLDRPKVRKALRTVNESRMITYLSRRGRSYTKIVQKLRYRREWVQPPARARVDVDHPYTKSGYNWMSAIGRRANLISTCAPYYDRNYFVSNHGDLVLGAWDSNKEIALAGKLREAVAGSDFNAGVAIAEAPKALAMIGDHAYRIANALRAVRRGDIVSASRFLVAGTERKPLSKREASRSSLGKDVSGDWLMVQYGWLPLLNDVRNGAAFLAHHFNTPLQQVVRVSVSSKDGAFFSASSPSNTRVFGMKSKNQVWVKAKIREKNVYQLAGLTDPLSIAWELLPYSFVADWFIPIGNWLQARALPSAIDATYVVSRLRTAECGVGQLANGSAFPIRDGWWKKFDFSRSVTTSFEVPLPSFKPLSKVASWQHAVNAVALLKQRFGS